MKETNRIDERLEITKKEKRIGIMAHLVMGYPTLQSTIRLARVMAAKGADFLELQIPFSDPVADGPTIMAACEKALGNGFKVRDSMEIAARLSSELEIPLVFMGYYNNIFKYGVKRFCEDSRKAGVSGLIVPDIPIDEEHNEHFLRACNMNGLYAIRVVSPASTDTRLEINARVAKGFIYCTARQGITGVRGALNPGLRKYLKNIKRISGMPLAVGFGISKREHVELLSGHAEIAVIGSAIIKEIESSRGRNIEYNVGRFISRMAGRS